MQEILELVLSWLTSFDWKIVFNYGFPAALCVYLLSGYRKTMSELNKTISNDLIHAIEKQGETIDRDAENTEKVEKSMNRMSSSMNHLTSKITELIEKK